MDCKEEKGLHNKKRTLLMIGGGIAVGLLGLISFKLGYDYSQLRVSRGLERVWSVTPELQDQMEKAMEKYDDHISKQKD